jgi:hypothetical protein
MGSGPDHETAMLSPDSIEDLRHIPFRWRGQTIEASASD